MFQRLLLVKWGLRIDLRTCRHARLPLPSALEPPSPRPAHRSSTTADEPTERFPASYLWAALLARIYDCFPLVCPKCGRAMELIAFVTEPASVKPPPDPSANTLAQLQFGPLFFYSLP